MGQVKLICVSGSTRRNSFNKKLVAVAVKIASEQSAKTTVVDLSDYPLPLYDGDLEEREGIPENAMALKKMFIEHDGFIIASPEYNSSYSGVLKNTIDWVSRPIKGHKPLEAFDGKFALILSASPGALGGLRGLSSLRILLSNLKVWVSPDQLAIGKANEAFDETGDLANEKQKDTLKNGIGRFLNILKKIHS